MHESWPACGGNTSVGTTRRLETEKSRSRASSCSNTIPCGVAQDGARRSAVSATQRGTSNAAGPRSNAALQHFPSPSTAAAPASSQLSSRPEAMLGARTGGHCGTTVIFDLLAKKLRSTSVILLNGEAPAVNPPVLLNNVY